MHKIVIENFGPVEKIELEVKDILVFIGPQASGKSTVSKAIYFFRSLKDDLMKYLIELPADGNFEKPLETFSKKIRAKFLDFWGSAYHLSEIYLKYNYDEEVFISVSLNKGYVDPHFSPRLKQSFFALIKEAEYFSAHNGKPDSRFLSSSELLAMESERRGFLANMQKRINELFADEHDLIFISAGRSLFATLSDQLQNIHPHKIDFLMRDFIERINNSKPLFFKDFHELITEKEKLTQEPIDFASLSIAQKIISEILKGKYRCDSEGEKIYFSPDKYVKLNYASSGQQEAVWILLLIFLLILNNKDVFIVFEEPEAHLYPEAQKEIIDLICLLSNLAKNQIIVTTHSPYILSSFNNLLYAYSVGMKKADAVSRLVNKQLWIDPEKLDAFFVANGKLNDIVDKETGLIEAEAIDSASRNINEIFTELFDLDDE